MDNDSVKKIINNSNLIEALAPMLHTPEGDALAEAAHAYRTLLERFDVTADITKFDGCDQALTLVDWIFREHVVDVEKIKAWRSAIGDAIAELAAGKIPNKGE